jgi:hypothetical protein
MVSTALLLLQVFLLHKVHMQFEPCYWFRTHFFLLLHNASQRVSVTIFHLLTVLFLAWLGDRVLGVDEESSTYCVPFFNHVFDISR